QQRPKFARPRERPFRHQLKCTIVLPGVNFVCAFRLQLKAGLIDPDKNEILVCHGFAPFTAKQISETVFATPEHRKKWRRRKKLREHHHAGPEGCNQREECAPTPVQPMHRSDYIRKQTMRECLMSKE